MTMEGDLNLVNDQLKRLIEISDKYRCYILEKCVCLSKNQVEKEEIDSLDEEYQKLKSSLTEESLRVAFNVGVNDVGHEERVPSVDIDIDCVKKEVIDDGDLEILSDSNRLKKRISERVRDSRNLKDKTSKTNRARNREKNGKNISAETKSREIIKGKDAKPSRVSGGFECEYPACNFRCKRSRELEHHINYIHTGLKPFACTYEGCDKHYYSRRAMQNHIKVSHEKIEAFACTYADCERKFKFQSQLYLHIRITHEGKTKPHVCEWPGCDFAAVSKSYLECHKRSHTGERPFKCDYAGCQASFMAIDSLKGHVQGVHLKIRKHKCDWPGCDGQFSNKKTLRYHLMREHTGEFPLACDWPECDHRCLTSEHLERHKLTHTGEKNFICSTCSKGFGTEVQLKRHKPQHSKELNHKCTEPGCSKAFASREQIYQHLTRVHRRKNKY